MLRLTTDWLRGRNRKRDETEVWRAAHGGKRFAMVMLGLAVLVTGCDYGGTYRPAPAPNPPPPPVDTSPPPSANPPPPPASHSQCAVDADCIGAFGNLGSCAVAVCTSGGVCMVSHVANGSPCSDSGCALGTCFAGDCTPNGNACRIPEDPPPPPSDPPSPPPPPPAASFCGDGVCDAGEDCSLCPSDCGTCAGACCEDNGSIGCVDPDIVDCVCAFDSYCCDSEWDAQCAAQVDSLGCGSCAAVPFCGDGICDAGDDCGNCAQDCGTCLPPEPFCGDGVCDAGDTCGNCYEDCGACPPPQAYCGDGYCDAGDTCSNCYEDCGTCPPPEPFCGDGLCNGGESCGGCAIDCGSCPDPEPEPYCGDGYCDAGDDCGNCALDCGACPEPEPYCGDGYCDAGDDCGNCALDCGACPEPEPYCGDGYCDAGDDCGNCAQDCGYCPEPEPFCGDGYCDAGDDCGNCPEDCGTCEGECCEDNGTIGCDDPDVTAAVCELDSFCCTDGWDADCASLAESEGLASCFVDAVCGDGYCEGNEDGSWCPEDCGELSQDCCMDVGAVGCSDSFIEQCVCDGDSYCCDTAWDDTCAALVDELGCGYCEVPPGN